LRRPRSRLLLEFDRLRPQICRRENDHFGLERVLLTLSTREPGKVFFRARGETAMNIIYSSDSYYVVEYPAQHGYELVDKRSARGTFFQGDVADRFVNSLQAAVDEDASVERVDEFLSGFDVLLNQPLVVH